MLAKVRFGAFDFCTDAFVEMVCWLTGMLDKPTPTTFDLPIAECAIVSRGGGGYSI
jgi:hypothetical protein